MRIIITLFLPLILLLGCSKDDPKPNGNGHEPTELTISLGADTTIIFGDTLTLGPGSGYATYIWNDGLSTAPTLPVWEAGSYWVYVTDSLGNYGADTIAVDLHYRYHSDTVPCVEGWKTYTLYRFQHPTDYQISLPCHYNVSTIMGDDGWGFVARNDDHSIWYSYSNGAPPFEEEIIYVLPDIFMGADSVRIIFDGDGNEVGVFYYHDNGASFRDFTGWFLIKEANHYVRHSTISYVSSHHNEVIGFLSTIKITEP